MTEADVIAIAREALWTVLIVSGPLMLLGLVIGLIVSLFQALTQIQEQTLTFVPKILIMFGAMVFLMPYMIGHMQSFMQSIADKMIAFGTG